MREREIVRERVRVSERERKREGEKWKERERERDGSKKWSRHFGATRRSYCGFKN